MDDDQKITTEDRELADMIAGLNSGVTPTPPPPPVPTPPPLPPTPSAPEPGNADFTQPVAPVVSEPVLPPAPKVGDSSLSGIKKEVLGELRPLVDKLDIPAEEKFDTLLLLIRSTDDKTLIESAYSVAKTIPDEKRRASALLDIIKEIDFFENPS